MNTRTMQETVTTQQSSTEQNKKILFLFDVDGTLSPSRQQAPEKIKNMLKELRKKVETGFIGGSDLAKQKEQIGDDVLELFTYGFPENGVQFYKEAKMVESGSILKKIGEKAYVEIANEILSELGRTDCPIKRGNFMELRSSVLNVSPIGRTCSTAERKDFFEYDKEKQIRKKMCKKLEPILSKHGLVSSIGGQISIDIFPKGWDKTYCLKHIPEGTTIIFFGDMTEEGGNDYEISNHKRVKGIKVTGPDDTFKKVNEELERLNMDKIDSSQ